MANNSQNANTIKTISITLTTQELLILTSMVKLEIVREQGFAKDESYFIENLSEEIRMNNSRNRYINKLKEMERNLDSQLDKLSISRKDVEI